MSLEMKNVAGLIAGIAMIIVLLVAVPATRWFLLFSVPLGAIVAVILYFWHKRHPARPKEDDSIKLHLE
jgi:hypothetical protein